MGAVMLQQQLLLPEVVLTNIRDRTPPKQVDINSFLCFSPCYLTCAHAFSSNESGECINESIRWAYITWNKRLSLSNNDDHRVDALCWRVSKESEEEKQQF